MNRTEENKAFGTEGGRFEFNDSEQTDLLAPFLAQVAEPVRDRLINPVPLPEFLNKAGNPLTLVERQILVKQALVLIEQNYVHLPLKTAMYAVNPVQRLRLLRLRLERQSEEAMDPEWQFHAELLEIFHSLRDLHTNYLLPTPFANKVAFLPFRVEEAFTVMDGSSPAKPQYLSHYVVSKVVQGFSASGFGLGAEVTHWSGIPIDRAVDLNAARYAGSNAAARHLRGLDSLTIRPLRSHLPPDEEWVTVSYVGTDGVQHELRLAWLVIDSPSPALHDLDRVSAAALSVGLDLDTDETNRARVLLFAPEVLSQEHVDQQPGAGTVPAAPGADLPISPDFDKVFRARAVRTSSGTFGHIRIFTFRVDNPLAFVAEFVRLIGLLPQNGLIVDVRDNGGGAIWASELTLQTLTPRRIAPESMQFISTPLNLRLCRKHKDDTELGLGEWLPSMGQALETGAVFSGAFPITDPDLANAIDQQYHGPVVLVTNAGCYSATDIFAAGFQDHEIGPILGVDDNTGAGGANVWTHGLLMSLLETTPDDSHAPYEVLPSGANMRVAIRRTLRVGALAGTPVEDLGVQPKKRHHMTLDDVLKDNVDLLECAGKLLAEGTVRKLVVTAKVGAKDALQLQLAVANVDRADIYVDSRPRTSIDITAGSVTTTIGGVPGARTVRVEGFSVGQLVAARTVKLQ